MYNLFAPVEAARLNNSFTNGLSRYTQANMQVTLENGLYHVYSPPNLIHDSSTMHNMWGGLRINNTGVTGTQLLTKGHTYIIKFHVRGKCSRSPEKFRWSYEMGWEGDSALATNPTNVTSDFIPNPFNGEKECFYKFTVSDDIYKVCSKSYGSHTAGTTYLSYDHFCFNYPYGNTGELGVDLYLSNFRMYDLTNNTEKPIAKKSGEVNAIIMQDPDKTQVSMYRDSEILCKDLYEI
jgi:hypothetical protein